MARPSGEAWVPLGLDSDPVPGDPDQISEQVQHLQSVAATLEAQISKLNQVANTTSEVGQHADKIKSTASGQVGQLQTLQTRYTSVSSSLSAWAPELAQAQAMSLRALNDAESAYSTLKNTPPPSGSGFSVSADGSVSVAAGTTLTSAQQDDIASYQRTVSRASGQLSAAQSLLNQAISLRDSQGSYYASKINNQSNDGLRDHWSWGEFFTVVCDVLEIIAAVAAIAAIFLTGPLAAIFLAVALWTTAAALLGRTGLALFDHAGWLPVILDAVSLLTLGLGSGLLGKGGLLLDDAGGTLESAIDVGDVLVSEGIVTGTPLATEVAKTAAEALEEFPPSVWEKICNIAPDAGEMIAKMDAIQLAFRDSPVIQDLGSALWGTINVFRMTTAASAALGALASIPATIEVINDIPELVKDALQRRVRSADRRSADRHSVDRHSVDRHSVYRHRDRDQVSAAGVQQGLAGLDSAAGQAVGEPHSDQLSFWQCLRRGKAAAPRSLGLHLPAAEPHADALRITGENQRTRRVCPERNELAEFSGGVAVLQNLRVVQQYHSGPGKRADRRGELFLVQLRPVEEPYHASRRTQLAQR